MSSHSDRTYDVIVAGGGLAGCTAAAVLARLGASVLVLEKDRFPRDKLCGEFLSTEVSELCDRLGILPALTAAGARPIRRFRMTSPSGSGFETPLPGTAMGLSRWTLDAAFFDHARKTGAEMRDDCAVRSIHGSISRGFSVEHDGGAERARFVMGAYGRRDALDRRLDRPFIREASPYVAFKAHFVGIDLGDCIELHGFPGGYCGLLMEERGEVNVCWITHQRALKRAGGSPASMMDSALGSNPRLHRRLTSLERRSEFHAAGQLFFRRKGLFDGDVCMIGDAAGMIAPLCGDGMGMAIASGEWAAQAIIPLLEGRIDASQFRRLYEGGWAERFSRRMQIGRVLHGALVRPTASELAVRLARLFPPAARAIIRATRQ